MKISIFGTRSGTEPSDGRMQTSFAVTVGEKLYWFDAGECCSETASEMGLDLLRAAGIFISHPHIDHTGGLVKLLWCIDKLTKVRKTEPAVSPIPVFCPCDGLWDAARSFFLCSAERMPGGYEGCRIRDGVIFDDGAVRVTALRSNHMPLRAEGPVCFSFLIEAEGRRVVYSGDVKDVSDFAGLLTGGCDLLLMETGHHDAAEVSRRLREGGEVQRILFVHHHRKTVERFAEVTASVKAVYGDFISFADDRDIVEL